jgi:hypothetical protein
MSRRCTPLLLALALWALFVWPLPLRMGAAIPYTVHHRTEPVETQSLVPGDHLQLLYHFWLTRDMLAGGTPWFHNLYEFHTGDDAARKQIDPGYLPFSLVYAALSPWLGHAFGWNAAQLAAVLMTFLFLSTLARRYAGRQPANGEPGTQASPRAVGCAAALVAMCAPYQWTNLGAGSPTGFGMAWIPALALGLDIAVRDRRRRGGALAGLALLFCYSSDLHSFFFGALLVPAWCVLAWVARTGPFRPSRRDVGTLGRALWPVVLAGIVAVVVAQYLQSHYATTDVATGRTIAEVLANSPSRRSLFGWILRGPDLHFQLGIPLVTVLAIVAVAALRSTAASRRDASDRRLVVALLLALGIVGILMLGLGLRGPLDGLPIRVVRKLLPPYRMIRQPVKVLCLLPTLVAAFGAIGLGALWQSPHPARLRGLAGKALVLVLVAVSITGTSRTLRAGLCRLPPPNHAYEAVARDAQGRGKPPHILALPLWPGDSAWSSLYEYHAMQGRIRMLNGYAPVRTAEYLENVFRRFESVTQGRLTDEQAAALRAMGVTAVVLHEEFPDVVSPFAVGATLRRLRANPWLSLLAHDGSAWAFALRETPGPAAPATDTGAVFAAARWWRYETTAVPAATNGSSIYVALRSPLADWPNVRWLVRTQGDGRLRVERDVKEGANDESRASLIEDEASLEGGLFFAKHAAGPAAPTPTLLKRAEMADGACIRWLSIPVGPLPNQGWATPIMTLTTTEGAVRVTDVLLAAGDNWMDSSSIRIPAAQMFRGGLTVTTAGEATGVVFRPSHDAAGDVLYGPNLPLTPGRWRVSTEGNFGTAAAGTLRVVLGARDVASGAVGTGAVPIEFTVAAMEPLVLRFGYAGTAEVRLDAFVLERIALPE